MVFWEEQLMHRSGRCSDDVLFAQRCGSWDPTMAGGEILASAPLPSWSGDQRLIRWDHQWSALQPPIIGAAHTHALSSEPRPPSTPFFRVEHGRGDWWVRALNWGLIGQEFPAWPPNILTKLWYHVARKWWLEHLTSILEEYICYEFSCDLNPNISNPRKYTKVSISLKKETLNVIFILPVVCQVNMQIGWVKSFSKASKPLLLLTSPLLPWPIT